jgi:hypothetical protein
MKGSRARLLVALSLISALTACASAGHVKADDSTYRFNRSDIEREGDHYRLWVWSYRGGLLRYFGSSPIGLQVLLPADTREGDVLVPGDDCSLWIRRDWNLVGAAANTLWRPVSGGKIYVDSWDPEENLVQGRLSVPMESGFLRGEFVISNRSLSDNVIR